MSGAPVRDRACGGRPGTPPDREYTHMWEMPSGLPVDPSWDLEGWSGCAINGTRLN